MINLSRVDLNLLVVLHTILAEGGVSRAAAKLNLTQSTISHALSRLRAEFGEPLFVRQGRALVPTALTRSLQVPLAQALQSLGAVLATASRFDARRTPAVFTIAVRDPSEALLLPAFARTLATMASNVEMRFVQVRRRAIEAGLVDGSLDAAIDIPLALSDYIRRQPLGVDDLVVIARTGHPQIRRTLGTKDYLGLDHVMVTSRRRGAAPEDLALAELGFHRRVRLRCRSYAGALRVVEQTDFVLTVPRSSTRLFPPQSSTKIHPLPFPSRGLETLLYWHEAMDADPGNRWLRELVLAALRAPRPPAARGRPPTAARRPARSRR
jgi:DNA-binding transcriptional LysR family regulator